MNPNTKKLVLALVGIATTALLTIQAWINSFNEPTPDPLPEPPPVVVVPPPPATLLSFNAVEAVTCDGEYGSQNRDLLQFGKTWTSWNVGVRFDANLDRTAPISAAILRINVGQVIGTSVSGTIYGIAEDNCQPYDNWRSPQKLQRTTAKVDFTIDTVGLKDLDIKPILQEIVSRPGYAGSVGFALVPKDVADVRIIFESQSASLRISSTQVNTN